MTAVISDTSPVNYLVLIGEIGLLPDLYRKISIPDVVLAELLADGSPATVAAWAAVLPGWVDVVRTSVETGESSLDPGELAAITLAGALGGDILPIMDDADGRAEAARRGIRITGTLGVLRAAAQLGLVDIDSALEKLRRTNFYLPHKLAAFLLAEVRPRSAGFRPRSTRGWCWNKTSSPS